MSRRNKTPAVSTITRPTLVAYARKQKRGGDDSGDDDEVAEPAGDTDAPAAPETTKIPTEGKEAPPDRPTVPFDPSMVREIANGAPEVARARVDTTGMPAGDFGAPPEIPQESSPGIVLKGGVVESPTHMPGPRDIPPGEPDDVASPPGLVPPGDSRSLRRRDTEYEFALVYRVANAVISRSGIVGTRGVWRVVEYPTVASAANAYAREASRFVTDGFSDYRE